jgi:predicted enzyme related to lactoylglutathione lyase
VAARTIGWRGAGLAPPIPTQFVLYVRDMGRAIAFYRDLMGLEVVSEDATFSVLGTGGASIGLHHTSSPEPHATPNAPVVSFASPDVPAAHRLLAEAGVAFTAEPFELAPGQWLAEFLDPDGNRLALISPP